MKKFISSYTTLAISSALLLSVFGCKNKLTSHPSKSVNQEPKIKIDTHAEDINSPKVIFSIKAKVISITALPKSKRLNELLQWEIVIKPEDNNELMRIHVHSPVRTFGLPAQDTIGKKFEFDYLDVFNNPYIGRISVRM